MNRRVRLEVRGVHRQAVRRGIVGGCDVGLRSKDSADLHVDLRDDVAGQTAPCPEPRLLDAARRRLRNRGRCRAQEHANGRVHLGDRLRDVAEIANTSPHGETALHRDAVVRPGVHVQFQALPVRNHVAVIAGERQVVVHRAERGTIVPQVIGGRLPAVGKTRVRGRGERVEVEVLGADGAVVGHREVPPPAPAEAELGRHARQDLLLDRRAELPVVRTDAPATRASAGSIRVAVPAADPVCRNVKKF